MSRPRTDRFRWRKHVRIIPSRYPPVDLFERIADPGDWEALAELEGLTNPRIRQEIGDISMVAVSERIGGPGASPVMAAFTHIGVPSRFTDGSYGVYYAAADLEGAIAETVYHLEKFLRATQEAPCTHEMRAYNGQLDHELHDVRGIDALHDPNDYSESQRFAAELRADGSFGLVYRSVRRDSSECLAAFRPKAVGPVRQGPHLRYAWNGERIHRYIKIGNEAWTAMPDR